MLPLSYYKDEGEDSFYVVFQQISSKGKMIYILNDSYINQIILGLIQYRATYY